MKRSNKLAAIVAAVVFCTAFVIGCGGSSAAPSTTAPAASSAAAGGGAGSSSGGFEFVKSGVTVAMNAPAADVVEKLGKYTYFESESCAFKGLDKQYDYGSFVLYTYPIDGVDFVNSIELKDDLVKTAEGVSIGSGEDAVKTAYGEPAEAGNYQYTKGDSKLLFIVKDGKVASIQYQAITK